MHFLKKTKWVFPGGAVNVCIGYTLYVCDNSNIGRRIKGPMRDHKKHRP